jgi:hypothetical protein
MKHLNGPYPIRPTPIKGELFLGFILRLGLTNGRITMKHVFDDFKSNVRTKCFFVNSKDFDEVAPYFAASINMPFSEFEETFGDDGLQQKLESIVFYRTQIGNPAFCPHCIAQHGYLKASWINLHENHCSQHECKLMQHCPECGKHQKWESTLLEGCTHCDCKWADVEIEKTKLPLYQQTLNKMYPRRREDYLNMLYIYVKFAMRPNDASHFRYRKILENIEDTTQYFEFAHKLAALEMVRCEYARHRKRHFANKLGINGNNRVLDVINLKLEAANEECRSQTNINIHPTLVVPTTDIPIPAPVNILTVNRKLHHAQNDTEYHLEWKDVQYKISMTKEELIKIIEAGILAKRKHTTCDQKLIPPGLNDVVSFHKKFKDIVKPISAAKGEKLLSWPSARKALRAKSSLPDLVIAAIQKQIYVYVKDPQDFIFKEIHFNEKDIHFFKTAA